jgi:hypothetical protein
MDPEHLKIQTRGFRSGSASWFAEINPGSGSASGCGFVSGSNQCGSAILQTKKHNKHITTFCFRESYGNFLARLETVFGVSQRGVEIIAAEMCELSNRVLSHCMKSVSEHLGKLKWKFKTMFADLMHISVEIVESYNKCCGSGSAWIRSILVSWIRISIK